MKIELEKDMYADLEKIEQRGKKKKKGFSLFGKKDEEPESGKEEAEHYADMKPESDKPVQVPPVAVLPKAQEIREEPKIEVWKPLTGSSLTHAKAELNNYKQKLDKAYKSKKLNREQCIERVKAKEIELGLVPPE